MVVCAKRIKINGGKYQGKHSLRKEVMHKSSDNHMRITRIRGEVRECDLLIFFFLLSYDWYT